MIIANDLRAAPLLVQAVFEKEKCAADKELDGAGKGNSTFTETATNEQALKGALLMKTKMTLQILVGVAIFFLLLTVRPAPAAEWVFCESNRSGHLYYDKTSMKKTGDIAQVRTMTIFSDNGKAEVSNALKKMGKAPGNPETLSYSISSEEFDCANQKMKISSMTIYNEKGGAIHSSVIKNAGWDDIIPGTNGEILGKIVCSGLK